MEWQLEKPSGAVLFRRGTLVVDLLTAEQKREAVRQAVDEGSAQDTRAIRSVADGLTMASVLKLQEQTFAEDSKIACASVVAARSVDPEKWEAGHVDGWEPVTLVAEKGREVLRGDDRTPRRIWVHRLDDHTIKAIAKAASVLVTEDVASRVATFRAGDADDVSPPRESLRAPAA